VSKRVQQTKQANRANRVVRESAARERRRTRGRWITVIAVLALFLAGVIGYSVYHSQKPTTFAVPTGVTDDGGSQAGLHVAGSGPVKVEVYLDYLCPFCKQFETSATPTINQMLADNKITLVWHTLSILDANTSPPGYSRRAANAAACASGYGKLKEYGEALYAHQPAEGSAGLTDDQLIDVAGPVGLNQPEFAQCVRNGTYKDWAGTVNDKAAQAGIVSTPTVLVNGKKLPQPTADALTAAVQAAQ